MFAVWVRFCVGPAADQAYLNRQKYLCLATLCNWIPNVCAFSIRWNKKDLLHSVSIALRTYDGVYWLRVAWEKRIAGGLLYAWKTSSGFYKICEISWVTELLLQSWDVSFNPLNAELNPIFYLLALLELTIFSTLAG